ncbi:MAG: hypothetical protein U0163_05525 [Gemmatimonadaceae bacterium]
MKSSGTLIPTEDSDLITFNAPRPTIGAMPMNSLRMWTAFPSD